MAEQTARVEKIIAAPASAVWRAITTPRIIKSYFFGAEFDTTWQVGSQIRIRGDWKGKPYEDKGEILTFLPEKQLQFSHFSALSGAPDIPESYHVVTYDLDAQGEQTKLTLSQSNLTGGIRDSDVTNRPHYEQMWTTVLDGIANTLAGVAGRALPRND